MKRQKKKSNTQTSATPKKLKNKPVNEAVPKRPVDFFEKYLASYSIWLLLALILLIGIFAFQPFFTGEYLFFFKDIGSDSLNQIYPSFIQKAQHLKENFSEQYSFFSGMGDSYHIYTRPEPYGIVRNLLTKAGIESLGEDYLVYYHFHTKFIFNFILSGLIFYFFLRTINISKLYSVIGALLVTFSAYMVVGSSWDFSGHIFRAVFLLFAFEQLFLKNRWYFFPFAIVYASGNLFILYIYSVFLMLYAIFRFTSENAGSIKDFFKLTGKMIALGIIGLLMNLTKIVSAFQKMFFSPRVSGNASYSQTLSAGETITEQSDLSATAILHFFSNDILGTGSNFQGWENYFEAPMFYIGLLTLIVFPQIFIFLTKRQKIIFGSFLGFWLLTVFIPYLRYALLAFTGDYFRFGFNFFIPFTFLFFSIKALHKINKENKLSLSLLLITLAVLFAALYFPYSSLPEDAIDAHIQLVVSVLLILYAGIVFLLSKSEYKIFAQTALLMIVVIELSWFAKQSFEGREAINRSSFEVSKGGYADGSIKAVDYIKANDSTKFYRTEKDYQSGNAMHGSLNDAKAQGYFGTTSYSSFNQLNYIRFQEEIGLIQKGDETATRWSTGFRGNPLLQTFGNVKYHLSKSENPAFIRFGFEPMDTVAGVKILKNKYFLPFGYTYDSYISFNDFKSLIEYRITEQSLNNLHTDLTRNIPQTEVNALLSKLQTLADSTFQTESDFDEALETGAGITEQSTLRTVKKYSTVNFTNQIALLNAFVYETDSEIDTSGFKRLTPADTATLVPPQKFNFELYEEFTSELKKDSFQIEEFSHSRITGSIDLTDKKMFFFSIPYDQGWEISLNGKKAELKRVNIGFSGIALPPGKHQIVLEYHPPYSGPAQAVSYISAVLFWLYLAYHLFMKRRKNKARNNEK